MLDQISIGAIFHKLSYLAIAAIGSLVPVLYRKEIRMWQAAVMVLAGTIGSGVLTRPIAMLLDPWLPGNYDDIDHSVAFLVGVIIMRLSEEILKLMDKVVDKIVGKYVP